MHIPLASLYTDVELFCPLFLNAHAISALTNMTDPIKIVTPATTTSIMAVNPSRNRLPPSVGGGSSDAVMTLLPSGGGCGVGECSLRVNDVATLLRSGDGCRVGDGDWRDGVADVALLTTAISA